MELAVMFFFMLSAGLFCLSCSFAVLALVWDALWRE